MDWLSDITKQTSDALQGASSWTGEATQNIAQWTGEQTQNVTQGVAAVVPQTLNIGEPSY